MIETEVALGKADALLKELMRSRDSVLTLRTERQLECSKTQDLLRFASQSRAQFMDAAALSIEGNSSRLQYLFDVAKSDDEALNHQLGHVARLEDTLSSQEYQCQECENSFLDMIKTIIDGSSQLEAEDVLQKRLLTGRGTAVQRPPPRNVHPILADYMDKVGDLQLLTEELERIDIDHAEASEARVLRCDHDETPSLSQSQFEGDYKAARADAEQRLALVEEQAEKRKMLCLDIGLDPQFKDSTTSESSERYRLPLESTSIAKDTSAFTDFLQSSMNLPQHEPLVVEAQNKGIQELICEDANPSKPCLSRSPPACFITEWLQTLPTNSDDPSTCGNDTSCFARAHQEDMFDSTDFLHVEVPRRSSTMDLSAWPIGRLRRFNFGSVAMRLAFKRPKTL